MGTQCSKNDIKPLDTIETNKKTIEIKSYVNKEENHENPQSSIKNEKDEFYDNYPKYFIFI